MPENLRRQVLRSVVRHGVLVVADLTSFAVMRGLIRAVRDRAVFGSWTAERVGELLPQGYLSGWQFATALLVSLLVLGCYRPGDQRRDVRRLFAACALAAALPMWGTIWTRGIDVVAVQYVLTVMLVWVGLASERLTVDRAVAVLRPPDRHAAQALFVGPGEDCRRVMRSPAFNGGADYRPVGHVDVSEPPAPESLGGVSDFGGLLHRSGAEVVVVCGDVGEDTFVTVVDAALAAGCRVLLAPRFVEAWGLRPSLVWRRGQPIIELAPTPMKGWQFAVKRVVDVVGAAAGLIVASPIMAAVAVMVRWDSPGPVLFAQTRVGQGGRPFRIIKFRTMREGAHEVRDDLLSQSLYRDARLFKIPDDPRVTRVGRFLRRTSLDELPQLINVLRGEMSLVGTRPPLPSEVAQYEEHHFARFDMKPGITGPWQVSGRNNVTDFEEVVRLEKEYLRRWSLTTDFGILLRTVPAVLRMRGAL
jgi:exopolysaccharide biosynthesis polyprenyl glycosylphosphotransferase